MVRYLIFILFIFFLQIELSAAQAAIRGIVKGQIRDAESGEPLPYTNVFLSNTTLGDAADDNGDYEIVRIPPGSYQLVVSRIGYEIVVQDIAILPGKTKTLDIDLQVKSIEGEEISIVGKKNKRQWKRDLKEFTRYFIGETPNASRCKIINPQILSFEREAVTRNLLASTARVLVVENRSLGYRIEIVLVSFRWGRDGGQYVIYPKYTVLEPRNEREHKRWQKNRRTAFRVSMRDFFAALATKDQNRDYIVYQVEKSVGGNSDRGIRLDSLNITLKDSSRGLQCLENDGLLQVERRSGGISNIDLKYDFIDFDVLGNIYPADGVLISGYWGRYRVADSLPFDYWPEN